MKKLLNKVLVLFVFASLVPDPMDENCPKAFKEAIELLLGKDSNPPQPRRLLLQRPLPLPLKMKAKFLSSPGLVTLSAVQPIPLMTG